MNWVVEEFIWEKGISHICFSSGGGEVFKQYRRAQEIRGSGGKREGPQSDKMATHDHRHYQHHRHSRGYRMGAPDPASKYSGAEGSVEGEGRERGKGWVSPTDL